MRLTQIKLAGFKSFTDPTTLHVAESLVAVVGPNGCGKSNVIDAVRWVLGESSAKQLRGESMQDVIFNGATTRRAAPRASVELIFDNSDARLQGAWGQYAEIAIKRQLTRQGESSYFINNQLVRRRDITDLFLGTGVGSRGYAVIEQGMISRIIEARPEELRTYLEEAAGISKYKERRRETELRLKDTREHLQRLSDTQIELSRQKEKLQQQAEQAKRYHALNDELLLAQNILDFSLWQQALSQADAAADQHTQSQAKLDALLGQQDTLNTQMTSLRETEQQQQQTLDALKQQYAQLQAQYARHEAQLLAAKQTQQRNEKEQQYAQQQVANLHQQHTNLLTHMALNEETLCLLKEEVETCALAVSEYDDILLKQEQAVQQQEHICLSQHETLSHLQRELAVKQEQLAHNDRLLNQAKQKQAQWIQERAKFVHIEQHDLDAAQYASEQAQCVLDEAQQNVEHHEMQLQHINQEIQQKHEHWQQYNTQLLNLHAQISALSALLQQQFQSEERHHDTLWQHIHVPEQWRHALVAILNRRINAQILTAEQTLPKQGVWLNRPINTKKTAWAAQALYHQLRIEAPFEPALRFWLAGVLCAPDLAYALHHQQDLRDDECWITPAGDYIDAISVMYADTHISLSWAIQQAQLEDLSEQLSQLEPIVIQAKNDYHHSQQIQQETQQKWQQAQANQRHALKNWQQTQQHAHSLFNQYQQGRLRYEHIEHAQQQAVQEIAHFTQQQNTLSADVETLSENVTELADQYAQQTQTLKTKQHTLKQMQLSLLEANRQYGAAQIAYNKKQQALENDKQQATQLFEQQQQWQQRAQEVILEQEDNDIIQMANEALEQTQLQIETLNIQLANAQTQLEQTQQDGYEQYQKWQQAQTQSLPLQNAIQTALLEQQQALLTAQKHYENLNLRDANITQLHQHTGDLNDISNNIHRLQQDIAQLGAVNLVALQELNEVQARHDYYLQQSQDVESAMTLLQQAMAQIDNETQNRFKETFHAVNNKMQEIFPQLFGGGQAQLALNSDDWLSAGVSIMAQPIGKKNSTIHLLSGGEKALTAMSLIFSLFSLNPAPFCLLDEIDAPLDDANAARVCNLIKHLSQQTQFLYISHKKISIEMAQQLIGVTMQEKGVSRVVTVNVQEAMNITKQAST